MVVEVVPCRYVSVLTTTPQSVSRPPRRYVRLAQVVRGFSDPDVIHVDGKVNPASDMETINTELIIADLQTLEKALVRYEKELKNKKIDASVVETAKAAQAALNEGKVLSQAGLDLEPIRELGLLTAKPFLYVFNVDETVLQDSAKLEELSALVAPAKAIFESIRCAVSACSAKARHSAFASAVQVSISTSRL